MKRFLLIALIINTSLFGQTETILTEDFNNEPTLPNATYAGDGGDSRVIDEVSSNIANKGAYLRLGYKGNIDSSSININSGAEPSDSVEANFIFGFGGNFDDGSRISYDAANQKVRISDARVEENFGAPLYSPVYDDNLVNFVSTTYFDLYNIKAFTSDQFYTGTYHATTIQKGVLANTEVPLLYYKSSITVQAYNADSSVSILSTPQDFPNRVCGNDPGFGDFNAFIAWQNCITNVEGYVDPYGLFSVTPNIKPGIDDLSATRYFSSGCSNENALNFQSVYKVDNGSCVLPEDLIDEANAELSINSGIDTSSTPIVERIRVNLVEECGLNLNSQIDTAYVTNYALFSQNDSLLIDWFITDGVSQVTTQTKHAITNTGVTKVLLTLYCNTPQGAQPESVVTVGDYTAKNFGAVFDSEGLTVGMNTITEENGIVVFPNPANQNGMINLSQQANWTLFSIDGRAVNSGFGNQIDLNNLQAGTYSLATNNQTQLLLIK